MIEGKFSGRAAGPAACLLFGMLLAATLSGSPRQPKDDFTDVSGREGVTLRYIAPGSETPVDEQLARLPGDGGGKITGEPAYLEPRIELDLGPLADAKQRLPLTGRVECFAVGPMGVRAGKRFFHFVDTASGDTVQAGSYVEIRSGGNRGLNLAEFPLRSAGMTVTARFNDRRAGTFHTQLDPGGYDGARIDFRSGTFEYDASGLSFTGNSTWHGLAADGVFRVRWIERGGRVSVEVFDETRGRRVPFSRWIDRGGWGFVGPEHTPRELNEEFGVEWGGRTTVAPSTEKRGIELTESLPAGNTESFHLYVNGQYWRFSADGEVSMPADGTVMRVLTAFGEWDASRTEFTQYPPPAGLHDAWLVEVAPRAAGLLTAGASPAGSGFTLNGMAMSGGKPLSCVTLELHGESTVDIRTTSKDGRFEFDGLAAGLYRLTAFKTGFDFEPAEIELQLDGDRELEPVRGTPQINDITVGDTVTVGGVLLVRAPVGAFRMGQFGVAEPLHRVKIDEFQIGVHEITQAQYERVTGDNPSAFGENPRRPVEQVSWFDAVRFCNALSRGAGLDACYDTTDWSCDFSRDGFRLPTEAEWEYACRAESSTNFFPGCDRSDLSRVGWFGEAPAGGGTHPVGEKMPNAWGMYDTHGNVWEWCGDWLADYGPNAADNPTGPRRGSSRVIRGGGWDSNAFDCRSATREGMPPGAFNANVGFRVARSVH